ncbi:hypothetical protein TNCV_4743491 [Trichonephila clavipes]|nr:hypothetical protein TNCV_4743491 [Trichonephila clavipes]
MVNSNRKAITTKLTQSKNMRSDAVFSLPTRSSATGGEYKKKIGVGELKGVEGKKRTRGMTFFPCPFPESRRSFQSEKGELRWLSAVK